MRSNAAYSERLASNHPDHLREMLEKAMNPEKKYLRWADQFILIVVAAVILF